MRQIERGSSWRLRHTSSLIIVLGLAALFLTACDQPPSTIIAAAEATPTATAYQAQMRQAGYTELIGDDLAAVPLPPNPSQADLGLEPYRQICLACHGDWGQGLTEAWRQEWGEDANCWQSRCHAPNHPDWGFELPPAVPPLLGPGSLSRYRTAAELQQNIAQSMPWWNPNSLSAADSWALTAFLMRTRGEIGDEVALNPDTAPVYQLHVPYARPPDTTAGPIWLLLLALLMLFPLVRRKDG